MNEGVKNLSEHLNDPYSSVGYKCNNPPLNVEDVEPVVLSKQFFNDNPLKYATYPSDPEGVIPPTDGKKYRDIINNIIDTLRDQNLLTEHLTEPTGLNAVPECMRLIAVEVDKSNLLTMNHMFPFDLSPELKYFVVSVDKSVDGSCKDNSFSTISVLVDDVVTKTYIRIAGEDNRWSDWLEFTDDIKLNVNWYKVYIGYINKIKDLDIFKNEDFKITYL